MTRGYGSASLALVSLVFGAYQSVPAHNESSFDPVELQKAFGLSRSFELITKVSDIPTDGQQMLEVFFPLHVTGSTQTLADFGMDWSSTDAKLNGLPWGQHLFSAMSDQFVAIVFLNGGVELRYNLILAPRNSRDFCFFQIPALHPSNFRVSSVQDFVRPDRDQTISKTPACQLMRTWTGK